MAAVVLGARIVSYLLYPNGDQRYTAILYVMVPVALVIASQPRNSPIVSVVQRAVHAAGLSDGTHKRFSNWPQMKKGSGSHLASFSQDWFG